MFVTLFVALAVGLVAASLAYGFSPAYFWAGGWSEDPLRTWLSPLASAFLSRDILSVVFNGVFLLIAGRYVERAIGPVGIVALFVAGAYGGALARLVLTPGAILPSAGFSPSLFAIAGAYFMLYGVPAALPVPKHLGRVAQIGALALLWLAVQIVFAVASRSFEISVSVIDPLGGLVAGMLLARPLLAWKYRGA